MYTFIIAVGGIVCISVVTISDFVMRYVSRYLCHEAIRIAILVYLNYLQKNP